MIKPSFTQRSHYSSHIEPVESTTIGFLFSKQDPFVTQTIAFFPLGINWQSKNVSRMMMPVLADATEPQYCKKGPDSSLDRDQ